MIRAALVAAVCLVLGFQWVELRAARADLDRAEARAAGFEEAARWQAQEARRRENAAALDQEFKEGVGADAPLSDYLRRGAGRVWPQG